MEGLDVTVPGLQHRGLFKGRLSMYHFSKEHSKQKPLISWPSWGWNIQCRFLERIQRLLRAVALATTVAKCAFPFEIKTSTITLFCQAQNNSTSLLLKHSFDIKDYFYHQIATAPDPKIMLCL
jgi:hypothetical protein